MSCVKATTVIAGSQKERGVIEQTSGCLIQLYYNNLDDKEAVSIVPA